MINIGDKLYLAKRAVEYELDDVDSVHVSRSGAMEAVRKMAEAHHRGEELKEGKTFDGELELTAKYGYYWYVEVIELEA